MRHNNDNSDVDNDVVVLRNRSLLDNFVSPKLGSIVALYALLAMGLIFVLIATFSPELRLYISIDEKPAAILLPLAAVLVGGIIKVYDIADVRLGTVDLFANEILNIVRVINASALPDALILQFNNPQFADYPQSNRNENYMMVLEKHSKELGFLPRKAISQIAAFYTLMKGARDSRGMLSVYKDTQMNSSEITLGKKATILATLYLLFLALEAGYYAMQELVSDEDEFMHYEPLFLRNMCLAYIFLLENLPEADGRKQRLTNQRRTDLFKAALLDAHRSHYEKLVVERQAA